MQQPHFPHGDKLKHSHLFSILAIKLNYCAHDVFFPVEWTKIENGTLPRTLFIERSRLFLLHLRRVHPIL